MHSQITLSFKTTPMQKETIESRMFENGFDDLTSYLKVVALRTRPFTITSAGMSTDIPSVELSFKVTQVQKDKIEEKMKECGAKELDTYLLYVGLHGVVTSAVEVRSSGTLEEMLKRIAQSRNPSK